MCLQNQNIILTLVVTEHLYNFKRLGTFKCIDIHSHNSFYKIDCCFSTDSDSNKCVAHLLSNLFWPLLYNVIEMNNTFLVDR